MVRAFFGINKYCIHFLNIMESVNKEKCIFIHNLANENNCLGINSNLDILLILNMQRKY